jgi:hypothetical protein
MPGLYIGNLARVMDFDAEYPVDMVFDLIVRWHGLISPPDGDRTLAHGKPKLGGYKSARR